MAKNNYSDIEEFYKAVKNGEVDESKLSIVLDNDMTMFYSDSSMSKEIVVKGTGGYEDVMDLYRLLFPEADVDWC